MPATSAKLPPTDVTADLLEIQRLAILMLAHPYRSLHGVFPILLGTDSPPVRGAARQLVTIRVERLENQPLPSQRHFDSNQRLWSHWRAEAAKANDPEVVALIDRALAGLRVYDPATALFPNPLASEETA